MGDPRNLRAFPPGVLVTETRDFLLSTTIKVHRKLRQAGLDAQLHVYEGQSHSQYLFNPLSATTREIYKEISLFFDKYLNR